MSQRVKAKGGRFGTAQWMPSLLDIPRPGHRIDERFLVRRMIAEGAMGAVVEAEDTVLQRRVAIKLIQPRWLARDDARERFEQEARAMASMEHENVVAIHSMGTHGSMPYFVMEYVKGRSLREFLDAQTGHVPLDHAIAELERICAGLEAIHAAGTVHRDIKPANILLTEDGGLKIADLGIAHGEGDQVDVAGTPRYMAPEIIVGRASTRAADIYALGVVAYEMITGAPPYSGANTHELFAAHISDPVPDPRERRPGLPQAIVNALRAALQKRPELRPASASRFARLLRRGLGFDAPLPEAPEYLHSLRIGVVDDHPGARELIEEMLRELYPDCEVECFAEPATAFAAAFTDPPDIVLTDLRMPQASGTELVRAIRGDPRTEGIPVLIMTAVGTVDDWHQAGRLGADGFLAKPFDAGQLADAIGRILRRRHETRRSGHRSHPFLEWKPAESDDGSAPQDPPP